MNHADWSNGALEEWVEALLPTHSSTPTLHYSTTPIDHSP
jgi:hypothetical protein